MLMSQPCRQPEPSSQCVSECPEVSTGPSEHIEGVYLADLDTDARDVDGMLLRAGTRILRSPVAPGEFVEDTPANRVRFTEQECTLTAAARSRVWFPPLAAMDGQFQSAMSVAVGVMKSFGDAVDRNLRALVGRPFPDTTGRIPHARTSRTSCISAVMHVADLSDSLVSHMIRGVGVPHAVEPTPEWLDALRSFNSLRLYSIKSGSRVIRAVAAFVCPVALRAGHAPVFAAPNALAFELVERCYAEWKDIHDAGGDTPVLLVVGSWPSWSGDLSASAGAGRWAVLLAAESSAASWMVRLPPAHACPWALRGMIRHLLPPMPASLAVGAESALWEFIGTVEHNLLKDKYWRARPLTPPLPLFSSLRQAVFNAPRIRWIERIDTAGDGECSGGEITHDLLWDGAFGATCIQGDDTSEPQMPVRSHIRAYEVRWWFAKAHVISAYIAPVQRGPQGMRIPKDFSSEDLATLVGLCLAWLREVRGERHPHVVIAVASPRLADDLNVTLSARCWAVAWEKRAGTWTERTLPKLYLTQSAKDFLELLRPETFDHKLQAIRTTVDDLIQRKECDPDRVRMILEGRTAGRVAVKVEEVRAALLSQKNYRRSVIAEVFFCLQETKHYELQWAQGQWEIAKTDEHFDPVHPYVRRLREHGLIWYGYKSLIWMAPVWIGLISRALSIRFGWYGPVVFAPVAALLLGQAVQWMHKRAPKD
jgi:hypothetical protein